jgi:hypothetical protein
MRIVAWTVNEPPDTRMIDEIDGMIATPDQGSRNEKVDDETVFLVAVPCLKCWHRPTLQTHSPDRRLPAGRLRRLHGAHGRELSKDPASRSSWTTGPGRRQHANEAVAKAPNDGYTLLNGIRHQQVFYQERH